MANAKPPYRTIVYIDGFNFYYGAVRGTPWKWLDPVSLFQKLLGSQNQLVKIRYFTARVQPSPSDPQVNVRQDTYLRALHSYCPLVQLHYGHFLRHPEEKGSDVNLAIHLLNDAWLDAYDCAVIVSNDSDLAESMSLVKAQTRKLIGLVTPGAPVRKTSKELSTHADFVKPIRRWMLEQSLLPDPLPGTTIRKPPNW
jgi:uncharacterized LabA/DUF88 family protein